MIMKTLKVVLIPVFVCAMIFACKKDNNNNAVKDTVYNYDVALNGASEVPANGSAATGKFIGSYTKSTRQLAFTLSYSGIAPTDWHIHKGAPGVSGSVEISLNPVVPSPLQKSVTLTPEQETDLLNGNFYVNIHSVEFPAGEIRAQLGSPGVVEKPVPGSGGY
jgi:hypothetical protein